MHRPHYFDGFATVEPNGTIEMHDTMEDACVYAGLHSGCNVYEASFTPTFDMTEVQKRHRSEVVEHLLMS